MLHGRLSSAERPLVCRRSLYSMQPRRQGTTSINNRRGLSPFRRFPRSFQRNKEQGAGADFLNSTGTFLTRSAPIRKFLSAKQTAPENLKTSISFRRGSFSKPSAVWNEKRYS